MREQYYFSVRLSKFYSESLVLICIQSGVVNGALRLVFILLGAVHYFHFRVTTYLSFTAVLIVVFFPYKETRKVTMATNYGDESRFECSLCLDRFADPRILPCIHTFCRNCLEKYLTEKYGAANPGTAFECPLCRAKHILPSGGIGGIQKNFYLEAPVRSQFPLCDTHPDEDLRFYCRNCDAAICRDCKVVSHESHTADLIKSLFAEVKSNFEDCLDDTEKNINENEIKLREAIEPEILSLETLMSDTKSHARILKRDIDNLVQDIEGLIRPRLDGKKQELLNIEERSDEKRKYLNDYYQRLLKAMESEEKHHILMLYKELVGKMKENESIEEFHFASMPGNLFDADRLDSECFRSFEVVAESIEECKKRISDCW